jgi:hypothetical protein
VDHSNVCLGQTRSFGDVGSTSGLPPPKADLNASSRHVAQVPKAAVSRRSNRCSYSITSSAVASNLSGTVRPSILAVEALMTSSNLLDCTTGKSAGFAPLRIWPV